LGQGKWLVDQSERAIYFAYCYNYSVHEDDYGDECDKMVAMMSHVHYTSSPFLLLTDKYFVIN